MLNKVKNRKQEGFTIIEVLIVLAIAGLIMLVVFMAVPALQRSSRNTQRKNDVSSLLSSVTESTNNNNGALPNASGTVAAKFPNNVPNFGYYTTTANVNYKYQATATVVADPGDLDKVVVANFAKCVNNAAVTAGATTRSIVVVYDVEGSGGAIVPQCQES